MELEFEDITPASIEGHSWAEELRESLYAYADNCLLTWCKVVIELGENEVELDKWVDIFRGQIQERYKELVMDVIDMKAKVIDNITELLEKTQSYAQELGLEENLLDINPNEKYYQVQKDLLKRTERLEKMMGEKRKELDTLLEKQTKLCASLQKPPIPLETTRLPSRDKIENIQKYIEKLEREKFEREERFLNLKESIIKMALELEMIPKSDFERSILADSKKEIDITTSNMEHLEKYHDDLVKQLEGVREEIDHLRKTVDDLWTILEESITERDTFHDRNPGYSMSTLKALRAEVKRCEELKKANIKIFVEKLRIELRNLWQCCYHQNEVESGKYPWFTSDFYTEDLLLFHEMEVNKWRAFYTRNEELIKLFAEHEKLWNLLLELQNKDTAGLNRYKNRGGELLREEKERNKLSKKIPMIEEKIKRLALEFEDLHGSSFYIFGTPILDFIENLHFQRDQEKKIKLSARKQIREQETLTPAKSCMSLFPSSSRVTPASAVKRKMIKPVTTGKKPKIESSGNRLNFVSVTKEKLNRSRRLSREKDRRIAKCRKMLNMKAANNNKENLDGTNMTDYDAFESGVFSLRSARSTQYVPNVDKKDQVTHE